MGNSLDVIAHVFVRVGEHEWVQYGSLDNADVNVSGWEREADIEKKSQRLCVCALHTVAKPRCNPEQEAGQGVTVGVKAPLLP